MFDSAKKYFLIFILIIILGLILRVYNLDHFPVFGDEAIYIRWSQQMRDHPELRFVPLADGKQPLFMWTIIPFFKIFDDPLFAGRFVSVLTGVGTMVGLFVLTLILFNKNMHDKKENFKLNKILNQIQNDQDTTEAALLAMFLYAVSPFSILFDRMALADSMLTMFGILTLIFGLLTVLFIRLDTAMIAGFALGGALLTKSPAVFFAVLLPSTVVFRLLKDKKIDFFDKNLIFIAPLITVTYLISYAMYNILRLGPNFHMLKIRTLDYVYPYSHVLESPLDPLMPFLDRIIEYYWIMVPGLVLILALFGSYKLFRKNKSVLFVLLIWLLLPTVVVAEYSRTLTARYVYFSVPYLFILASGVIYYKSSLKNIVYLGILLVFLLSLRWNFIYHTNLDKLPLPQSERSGYLEEWTSGTGLDQVVEYITDRKEKTSKTIVIGTEGHFGTLPQGLEIHFVDDTQIEVVGVGINLDSLPSELAEAKREGKEVYLVINDERLSYDASEPQDDDLTLRKVDEYPKATREDGSVQKLQFYELIQN